MKIKEIFEIAKKYIDYTRFEGWDAYAHELKDKTKYPSILDEINHLENIVYKMASKDIFADRIKFSIALKRLMVVTSGVANRAANEIAKKYTYYQDVPDNIFRCLSYGRAFKVGTVGCSSVKIVPFIPKSVSINIPIYTIDEYKYIKSLDLKPEQEDNMHVFKVNFPGSKIQTDLDVIMSEMDLHARVSVSQRNKTVVKEADGWKISMPVEEQQRYYAWNT